MTSVLVTWRHRSEGVRALRSARSRVSLDTSPYAKARPAVALLPPRRAHGQAGDVRAVPAGGGRAREHPAPTGGFVLSANHVSNFDPWPLGVADRQQHYLRHMAKSELYWRPLKWVVDAGGGFPVRRGERRHEGDGDGGRARATGRRRRDVPRGDAAQEGTAQEVGGAGPLRRGADRARGGRPARPRRDRAAPTGSRGSGRCASATAPDRARTT